METDISDMTHALPTG